MRRHAHTSFILAALLPCSMSLGQAPPCHADWNHDCAVTVNDIFAFLSDYFSPVVADVNADGVETTQDIFVLLGDYFAGCNPCAPGSVRMVVFGDSLSDTGQHFRDLGTPAAPNYLGRYSDGPVWTDYLGAARGLSWMEVRNYAYGGASSGAANCCPAGAPGLTQEVADFVRDAPSGQFAPDALYVMWIGANDFEIWQSSGLLTTQPPHVLINSSIANISTSIQTLASHGAQRILVANLPNLGNIPKIRDQNDPVKAALATTATIMFNANLAWELGRLEQSLGIDLVLLDVYSAFEAIQASPAAFGFSDATTACLLPGATTECANPSSHVFWDNKHPTSATHQLIAAMAGQALATGGSPLPSAVCEPSAATVTITTPNGLFTILPTFRVSGIIGSPVPIGAELWVNGQLVTIRPDGGFDADIGINSTAVAQPVVAELRAAGKVLDRDRLTVLRGSGLQQGAQTLNAVVARLNANGIPAIRDQITFTLAAENRINLNQRIPNPMRSDYSGTLQFEVRPTGTGYSCNTVDAELHDGFIRLRFALHDAFITYHVHAWVTDVGPIPIPDPGLECDGVIYAARVGGYLDVAVEPVVGGTPGRLRVRALSPELQFDNAGFTNYVAPCNLDLLLPSAPFQDFVRNSAGDVEQAIRTEISEKVTPAQLAADLQELLSPLSVSLLAGDVLQAGIQGEIGSISESQEVLKLALNATISGPSPSPAKTLAVPRGALQPTSLDPVSGQPYAFAASVALESLNQLMLARSNQFLSGFVVTEVNLGGVSTPVTAGMLAGFVPTLHATNAATPYFIRIRPMLPPMIVGAKPGDARCLEVHLDQLEIEIIRQGATTPEIALAVDVRAFATLGFDTPTGSLIVGVSIPEDGLFRFSIIENRVCADELALARLMRSLSTVLVGKIQSLIPPFPLPDVKGVNLLLKQMLVQDGYATLYFDLASPHSRPDLAVIEIDMPSAIDINFPFDVPFRIKNVGGTTISAGAWMGASLSPDAEYYDGNNFVLTQQFFNFAANPLGPGESRWLILHNVLIPSAPMAEQTLFVTADVPANVGGGGMLCESSERNNHAGVTILTTTADARIVWVHPPDCLAPLPSPGVYQVLVARNNVGIEMMAVPVRVTVGSGPGIVWGDAVVQVPRGGQVSVTIFVPTPVTGGNAQIACLPVNACANLAVDSNRANDCANSTVCIACPDIAITALSVSSGVHLSGSSLPVNMTLRNHSSCPVRACAHVTCGVNFVDGCWDLLPSETRAVTCTMTAPPSQMDCGQADNFSLTVCVATNTCDRNPADNCRTITVPITDPIYNIHLSIPAVSSVCSCGTVGFYVDVTNVGEVNCPSICFLAGVVRNGSDAFGGSNPMGVNVCVTNIAPGRTKRVRVCQNVCGLTWGVTQYLKVATTPQQDCHTDGNSDTEAVAVNFCNQDGCP